MVRRQVLFALLVPSGVFVGHALASALTYFVDHVRGHPLLPHSAALALGSVALPLAFVAVVWTLSTQDGLPRPRLLETVCGQVVLYGVLALIERSPHGQDLGLLLHEPALWIGISCQLVAALLVSAASGALGDLQGCLLRIPIPNASLWSVGNCAPTRPLMQLVATDRVSVASQRGPPRITLVPV